MSKSTVQDPLHGVTLKMVVTRLVEKYGWEELGRCINIKWAPLLILDMPD